jgi:hypothetical protein
MRTFRPLREREMKIKMKLVLPEKLAAVRLRSGRRVLLTVLGLAVLTTVGVAQPALAGKKQKLIEEFATFSDCPVTEAQACVYSRTTGGEFTIGKKSVPINKTLVLQGGLPATIIANLKEEESLLAAADGNTLSRTPLTVPGGLTGIKGLEGEEVTATAEIAGPVSSVRINKWNLLTEEGTALTLPLKVKLSSSVLGEECYIGTDAEPILLHLTTGKTSPPSPNTPISGTHGTVRGKDNGNFLEAIGSSLVDNSFSVPGATGCGGALSFLIDPIINVDIGLPAAAGSNTAIMESSLEQGNTDYVLQYWPTPTITNISPNTGPKAGGTLVTVTGTGFGPGSAVTAFKFGKVLGTSVNCISNTTCTVVAPTDSAKKAGPVDVGVTVHNKTSKKNPPADQFTYE